MEIRLARVSELEAVKEVVDAAFSVWIDVIDMKPRAMLTEYKALIEQEKVFVGLINDEIVGVLVMWIEYDSLYIEVLAVNPKAQKQGIGLRLLKFAEAEALQHQQSKISLCTNEKMQANRDYYAHLGYHETRIEQTDDGRSVVWMEKDLVSDKPDDRDIE
jgi:N-acetylglutamate synthase-like GNAT family acetyltransferase